MECKHPSFLKSGRSSLLTSHVIEGDLAFREKRTINRAFLSIGYNELNNVKARSIKIDPSGTDCGWSMQAESE